MRVDCIRLPFVCNFTMAPFALGWGLLVLLSLNALAAEVSKPGKILFQRCAVCHQASAEGIPGAFPPLKNRLATLVSSVQGRAYVIMVVKSGLMGPIEVAGTMFRGVMPAQPFSHEQIADVLNYVARNLGRVPPDWQPFSAEEVATTVSQHPASSGQRVLQMRHRLLLSGQP